MILKVPHPELRLEQEQLILKNFSNLGGPNLNLASPTLMESSFVVVSHGTEADPILNYGNLAALKLWDLSWSDFVQTPSRLTAEKVERAERELLLKRVTENGMVDDYSGIRVTSTGKRFMIHQAWVFNLKNDFGQPCGQSAIFRDYEFL